MNPSLPEVRTMEYGDFSLKLQAHEASENRFVKVQVELTYACNLHCVHCYTDPYNKPELIRKELDSSNLLLALDRLREEGFLWLCFTGGEIFMRKDFLQIYDHAYRQGFLISLFTNATLITDNLADHLKEFPPFSIEVTLYGATADTYEKVTQVKGSYAKCLQGLRLLTERSLPVKLKTSLMTLNAHELDAMQELANGFGLSFKWSGVIYPRLDGDISSTAYRLSPEELLNLEFGAGSAVSESCVEVAQTAESPVSPPQNLYRCGCGKLNAHINPYGKVGTCTWSQRGRFDFRNKTLQGGMTEIADEIRGMFYNRESACQSCTAFQFCDKMPEMASHETSGDPQAPVPHFCDVAFGRAARQTGNQV